MDDELCKALMAKLCRDRAADAIVSDNETPQRLERAELHR